MRAFAILPLVLLAACSRPSTATPSTSPSAIPSPSAVTISTDCPATGKARAAVMPALTMGTHPTLIYTDEPPANGAPVTSHLMRYDVATASKVDILQAQISGGEVSPDGRWIALATMVSSQPALQLVRADGKALQTLVCGAANGGLRGISWSPDQKSLLFSATIASGPPPIYRLDLATGALKTPMEDNELSTEYDPLSWVDGHRLLIAGRPIGPAPGNTLRLLDLSLGDKQQSSALPLVLNTTAECVDTDNMGTTLYVSRCTGAFSDQGGGSMHGPSTVSAQPVTGGASRIVFTGPRLAVTQLRTAPNGQLLLSVSNQDPQKVGVDINGLWRVNADGSGLSRLVTAAGKHVQFPAFSQASSATVSRDGLLYVFQVAALEKIPSYSLLVGPLAGGQPTTIASRADGGLLGVIGWTTS